MSQDRPLVGKKIAVVVETEYVPEEIRAYQERFEALGAKVEFMSRLWGQPKLTFVSDVDGVVNDAKGQPSLEATQKRLEMMEVTTDFRNVKLEDYAAVLMAANYTSARLRYFRPRDSQQDQDLLPPEKQAQADGPATPDMVRIAPAVRFMRQAMENPRIVKGLLCHGLWLLTPTPELLAGRRVSCNVVVLADVLNAGATYVPSLGPGETPTAERPAPGVVVDNDLVTGDSYRVAAEAPFPYIEAIKEAILRLETASAVTEALPQEAAALSGLITKSRRILIVLSEHGYWGEELVGPLDVFDQARYEVEFATPTGKRPGALPPSMNPDYIDPPLNRPVVSEEMARKTRELDDTSPTRPARAKRLDKPRSLATPLDHGEKSWVPERPYWSHPNFVRLMENYNRELSRLARDVEVYDALLIVGGSGPIVDLVNNQRVHDLILAFYAAGKPVGAECYGVTCLAFARDPILRKSIIRGKHVTGHCLEYDYKDGTGFLGTDFNMGPPPYPLEYILRDATGPDGGYIGNFGKERSVIVDYPFITGRSTADSTLTGIKIVEVLEKGLRKWPEGAW